MIRKTAGHERNLSAFDTLPMRVMKAATFTLARQLPMPFHEWVARTCAVRVAAIRSLPSVAPSAVRELFAIADDGSFMLDAATLVTHGA